MFIAMIKFLIDGNTSNNVTELVAWDNRQSDYF